MASSFRFKWENKYSNESNIPRKVKNAGNGRRQMENLITIIIMLVAVGCGKSLTEEEKKVVGSYEAKEDGETSKLVFS